MQTSRAEKIIVVGDHSIGSSSMILSPLGLGEQFVVLAYPNLLYCDDNIENIGKTSLVRRFCEGKYTENYKATIGVDFIYQKYKILKQDFTLHIWDTAGKSYCDVHYHHLSFFAL